MNFNSNQIVKQLTWFSRGDLEENILFESRDSLDSLYKELQKINQLEILKIYSENNKFTIQIGLNDKETHAEFCNNFYIKGDLKNYFKLIMTDAKKNKLAFMMSALKTTIFEKQSDMFSNYYRHFFYEIKSSENKKFFAQTPANKKSFSYFNHMLFFPNTLSMVIYYDYDHKSRYFQTFFGNYSQSVEAKIIEDKSLFKEYTIDRHKHNLENDIIYASKGEYSQKNPLYFWPDEESYFEFIDPSNKKFFPFCLFDKIS
jgi:hypothetical protein